MKQGFPGKHRLINGHRLVRGVNRGFVKKRPQGVRPLRLEYLERGPGGRYVTAREFGLGSDTYDTPLGWLLAWEAVNAKEEEMRNQY